MKAKNINIIVTLLAEILVVIFSLMYDFELKQLAYTMLIVLIIFFSLGSILQLVVNKAFSHIEEKEREEREREEKEESEEEKTKRPEDSKNLQTNMGEEYLHRGENDDIISPIGKNTLDDTKR